MTLNEMSTAVQHGAPVITIVANNGQYGTIRMHQERHYPGRVSGTQLVSPDFAALARAYGGHGETVEATADFADAFARARAAGKPAIIELRLDPEALSPGMTLAETRAAAVRKPVTNRPDYINAFRITGAIRAVRIAFNPMPMPARYPPSG